MNRWNRNVIAVTSVGLLCVTQGCELWVHLDRTLVNAADDAGCAICSGPTQGDGGDDAAEDAATDANADAAHADTMSADAANADADAAHADAMSADAANADAAPDAFATDSSVAAGGG